MPTEDKRFFKKEDVLKAFTYIIDDDEYEEWAENFRKNFIDNFEGGKSVFYQF